MVVLTNLDDTIDLKENVCKIARTHNSGLPQWPPLPHESFRVVSN